MPTLTAREQRLTGLGLAAVVTIAAYVYLVEPLLTRQRALAELVPTQEAILERRRLLIAQRVRISAELDASMRRLEEERGHLLPGPTAPLAASALQKLVKGLAAEANVDVRSERVLPAIELAGLHEVPIELTVAGTIRQTVGLLDRLEHAEQLLTVKDLKLRLMAVGQPRELLTTVIVAGYFLPGTFQPDRVEPPAGTEAR